MGLIKQLRIFYRNDDYKDEFDSNDELKNKISWNIFLWGHYHKDRIERPHCEMYFQDIEDLTTIWDRWNKNSSFNHFSREKSPYYYFNDNPWTEKINKLK